MLLVVYSCSANRTEVRVWCDMQDGNTKHKDGGGWTVVINRDNKYFKQAQQYWENTPSSTSSIYGNSDHKHTLLLLNSTTSNNANRKADPSWENFNRSWHNYESGFGDRDGEYFLGTILLFASIQTFLLHYYLCYKNILRRRNILFYLIYTYFGLYEVYELLMVNIMEQICY